MELLPGPICRECRRDGGHGVILCTRCGGEMERVGPICFMAALLVIGVPLAFGPAAAMMIEFRGSFDPDEIHDGYVGLALIGMLVTMGVAASIYVAVAGVIGYGLSKALPTRSLGSGMLYGLGWGGTLSVVLVLASMFAISIAS